MKQFSSIHRGAFVASLLLCGCLMTACHHSPKQEAPSAASSIDYAQVAIPEFNSDSAFRYASEQLDFGFRTPGSGAHAKCAAYLKNKLSQWCDTVVMQEFNTKLWNGTNVTGKNIIGSLNPEKAKRILLGAHWDSRMWADHDPDEANHKLPLPGANDGASGIAVLMEMARAMSQMRPDVGVDFICFDVEDQGVPEWAETYEEDSWCKGSQFWSKQPHVPYYQAVYGILLDMVGTQSPRFTKEEFSLQYAPGVTAKLWNAAAAIGHGNVFVDQKSDPILDDHLYVNRLANIPMVDIVQNTPGCSFYPYWHTVKDDINAIDANTLGIVGNVVMKVIYGDYNSK